MKYKIKLAALAVAATVLLAGCSATFSNSKAQTSTAASSVAQANETGALTGRVTAVENGSITVETGTLQTQATGNHQGDTPPQGQNGQGDSRTTPPQGKKAPSGSDAKDREAPSGNAPEQSDKQNSDKGPGGTGGFISDGGTLTIAASDSLTITKNSESAAFSDIAVGDLLRLTGSGEGSGYTATSIEILSIGGENGQQQGSPGGQGGVDSVAGSTSASSQQ